MTNFAPCRMMTFDVIGTLIDFEAGVLNYLRPLAADQTDEALLAAFGAAEGIEHEISPERPFTGMLAPVYRRMAERLPLPTRGGEAEGFAASIPDWPAFADSVEALNRLGAGRRLVALTNSDHWAVAAFAATLGDPFDDIVTAEDVGVNKPDPQVFAYCRGRQSVQGIGMDETVHVAQSQYHDIGVAMRLGYRTAWIERRAGKAGSGATPAAELTTPTWRFTSLGALADAVAAEGA